MTEAAPQASAASEAGIVSSALAVNLLMLESAAELEALRRQGWFRPVAEGRWKLVELVQGYIKCLEARAHPERAIPSDDLAGWLGCSQHALVDLARRNILVRAPGRRGGFLLRPSVKSYSEHTRKALSGRGGEAMAMAAAKERARLAKESADRIAIKNSVARGDLVEARDVEGKWSAALRAIRAGMLAVPSRVGARLPHLTAADVVEIDREVRDALTEEATRPDEGEAA
jgi:phage terminase Nu1 subunit (DNA packaging protein)